MVIAKQSPRQWVVASETRPDTLYVVRLVNGFYSCDCAGHYRWSRCKHADAVRKAQPVPAADPAKIAAARAIGMLK